MKRAIFLDKDGTLIYNVPYNVNPQLIKLTKGAIEGLQKLAKAGFEFYIITNQQGLSLGYFTEEQLIVVRETLEGIFHKNNLELKGFYFCPHHQGMSCLCHKPHSGLMKKAALEHTINLNQSWMIGDTPSDIRAGIKAGCKTILFDKGYENEWVFTKSNQPNQIVTSLNDAADYILLQEENSSIHSFLYGKPISNNY